MFSSVILLPNYEHSCLVKLVQVRSFICAQLSRQCINPLGMWKKKNDEKSEKKIQKQEKNLKKHDENDDICYFK